MPHVIHARLLVITFLLFGLLYRVLCVPVGLLVLSAGGLLIVQQYWHALGMLVLALLYYELVYWVLIGRWRRAQ